MADNTTQILHDYSIDGPIGPVSAMGLGVSLALLFAWLLWLERRALGRWAGMFWLSRLAALCLVLGMLLGPSWVTRHRTTHPQAVAILVDTSDSMSVSDHPTTPGQQRWTMSAANEEGLGGLLTNCDRATVAVRMASHRCREAHDAIDRHQPLKTVRLRIEGIEAAATRAINHLEACLSAASGTTERETVGRLERVLQQLEGKIVPQTHDLAAGLDSGALSGSGDLSENLQAVAEALSSAERRIDELTRQLERDWETSDAAKAAGEGAAVSRKEQVANTLGRVEDAVAPAVRQDLSMKRMGFDRQAVPLPAEAGWKDLLLTSHVAADAAVPEGERSDPSVTNVSAVLDQLSRTAAAESIRSAILITDGAHNVEGARAPQEVASALGDLPVYVVPIGTTEIPRDVLLHRVEAPQAVVEKDSILIDVIVTAFRCAGEQTMLTLRKDGEKIDEQKLRFDNERGDQRAMFQVPAEKLGRYEFEVAVDPLEGETSTTNNVAQISVDVVKDTLRILLADRIARWEYRYLDQLFRRDESVTFDKLLFHPEPTATGKLAATGGLPRDVDGWAEYDVVILGDLEPAHLDEQSQKSLEEYVRDRGGELVVIAGNESMPQRFAKQPLMSLLPVESSPLSIPQSGLQLALTSAGKANPAMAIADTIPESLRAWTEQFQSLPIYFLSEYSRPKPTAEVLIAVQSQDRAASATTEDGKPEHGLLIWHQVGAGRVAYLSSPATYRLRFRQGDRYHHRFWGQLLRWLTATERASGTQTVRIVTDRIRYEQGDAVDVTVRLSEEDGDPVVDAALGAAAYLGDKQVNQIELTADEKVPGRYSGSFANLSAGAYRIVPMGEAADRLLKLSSDPDSAEVRVNVAQSGSPELVNTQCNLPLLRQIAEVTGGQVVPPTAIDEILALSATEPEVTERVERQPLWNRWSLLCVAFGCLCTEWIVRKRLGLV